MENWTGTVLAILLLGIPFGIAFRYHAVATELREITRLSNFTYDNFYELCYPSWIAWIGKHLTLLVIVSPLMAWYHQGFFTGVVVLIGIVGFVFIMGMTYPSKIHVMSKMLYNLSLRKHSILLSNKIPMEDIEYLERALSSMIRIDSEPDLLDIQRQSQRDMEKWKRDMFGK